MTRWVPGLITALQLWTLKFFGCLNPGAEEEADDPGLQERLEAALAQCVFCLYGVDLPWRDVHWGGGSVEVCYLASVPGITPLLRIEGEP